MIVSICSNHPWNNNYKILCLLNFTSWFRVFSISLQNRAMVFNNVTNETLSSAEKYSITEAILSLHSSFSWQIFDNVAVASWTNFCSFVISSLILAVFIDDDGSNNIDCALASCALSVDSDFSWSEKLREGTLYKAGNSSFKSSSEGLERWMSDTR